MVENNLRGLPVAERHGDDPILVGMVSRATSCEG